MSIDDLREDYEIDQIKDHFPVITQRGFILIETTNVVANVLIKIRCAGQMKLVQHTHFY